MSNTDDQQQLTLAESVTKKSYQAPELQEHGSVRELTKAATGTGPDGGTFS